MWLVEIFMSWLADAGWDRHGASTSTNMLETGIEMLLQKPWNLRWCSCSSSNIQNHFSKVCVISTQVKIPHIAGVFIYDGPGQGNKSSGCRRKRQNDKAWQVLFLHGRVFSIASVECMWIANDLVAHAVCLHYIFCVYMLHQFHLSVQVWNERPQMCIFVCACPVPERRLSFERPGQRSHCILRYISAVDWRTAICVEFVNDHHGYRSVNLSRLDIPKLGYLLCNKHEYINKSIRLAIWI